jgi:hypothetical protein
MTTDLNFPITLRASAARKSVFLVLAAFVIWRSFNLFAAHGTTQVPLFGYVPKHEVADVVFAVGVMIAIGAAYAFVSGRPSLLLNADGFVYTPTFSAARRLAWSEIDSLTTYIDRYASGVAVRTRAGKYQRIPALQSSPADLRELLLRCAEAAGQARQKT